jgi:hypothetical protein
MAEIDWRDKDLDEPSSFLAIARPHFDFLVGEFGFDPPRLAASGIVNLIRYSGPETAVELAWDTREHLYESHLLRRLDSGEFDEDDRHWLTPNDILAVRHAQKRWITADDLARASRSEFELILARDAANLREFCADVLRGDWSVVADVAAWHRRIRNAGS